MTPVEAMGLSFPNRPRTGGRLRQGRRGPRRPACAPASAWSRAARSRPCPQPGNPQPRLFRLPADCRSSTGWASTTGRPDAAAAPGLARAQAARLDARDAPTRRATGARPRGPRRQHRQDQGGAGRGRDSGCSGGNTAGLFELSEPQTSQTRSTVQNTFRNIEFRNNIPPLVRWLWDVGGLKPARRSNDAAVPALRRPELLRPGRKRTCSTESRPPRHGDRPVADGPRDRRVCSAAGDSADEAYYSMGIIVRLRDRRPPTTTEPLDRRRGDLQCGPAAAVRRLHDDCLDNESFHEAMEFAAGNYGLMQSALDYADDTTAPVVDGDRQVRRQRHAGRAFHLQRGVSIFYTTDGSTPTDGLHRVEAEPRPRAAAAGLDRAERHAEVDRA